MDARRLSDALDDGWLVTLAGSAAMFEAKRSSGAGVVDLSWHPRACSGVGLGIPLARAKSLVDAIAVVLDQMPVQRWLTTSGSAYGAWSRPGLDRTEQVVYLRGPVVVPGGGVGYRLTPRIEIALEHLNELQARLNSGLSQWWFPKAPR